jgi:hypothetical protein
LHFFEIGNCLGGFAGKIEREAGELSCFGVIWIFGEGALKRCYGAEVIAFAVIDDAKLVRKIFCRGVRI